MKKIKINNFSKCVILISISFTILLSKIYSLSVENETHKNEITKLEKENKNVSIEKNSIKEELVKASADLDELNIKYNDLCESSVIEFNTMLEYIEPLKQSNPIEYMKSYDKIIENMPNRPETIYDYTTDYEFNLLCRLVQAEIGIGDFYSKVNVANTIINRYYDDYFPNNWEEIIYQEKQYLTISNGNYLDQNEIQESVKYAIEWAFLFGSEQVSDATFFHSIDSNNGQWFKDNLEYVGEDNYHKFYKLKET